MASSGYKFSRDRMYDPQGVHIATVNEHGLYIDKGGKVRASQQFKRKSSRNHERVYDRERTPVVYDEYGRDVDQLSSSAPGRKPSSQDKNRATNGFLQFPEGLVSIRVSYHRE